MFQIKGQPIAFNKANNQNQNGAHRCQNQVNKKSITTIMRMRRYKMFDNELVLVGLRGLT